MNFKRIGASFAGLLLLAAAVPATAADIPPPILKAPRSVFTAYNWTGFYAGVNFGYGWTGSNGAIALGGVPGPISAYTDGVLGGVQFGWNYQVGSFVWGFETDFQATDSDGKVLGTPPGAVIRGTGKVPWFGTVRGRLGWAVDKTLFYFTGGGLYGNATLDGTVSTTGPFSASTNYWTYVVGGGFEQAFWDRWTAKLEYLYAGTPDHVPVPPGTTSIDGGANNYIVRAGVNYRF